MKITAEQHAFLTCVRTLKNRFNAVRAGSAMIPLCHPFWSESEIETARRVQEDWDIPKTSMPFYGDWHTVICLIIGNGSIEMLDDARNRVFLWPSIDDFLDSLATVAESPSDTSRIIDSESWLDF